MKYKLSICMMVKNEELHLERCLNSIKSIIDRSDVELIIVDTGSTDKTVEIANRYTQKVYFKEWFNDFSGMRNISISYATGDWLFLIDADETVENVDAFICFLDNEISNDINTYFTKEKNYVNLKNKNAYSLINTPRFFKNDGEFRYEGTVHNQPIYKHPVKHIDIMLGHYGYIVMDKKIMEEKFRRTSSLLIEELKKDANNLYYMYQLATSYNMYGDVEKSYEISKKAYDILINLKKEDQLSGFTIFSVHLTNSLLLENYIDVIEIAKKSIQLREDYIDAYFFLIYAYEKLGNIEASLRYCHVYLDLVDRFDTLYISKDDSIAIYRNDSATINKIKMFMFRYYFNVKKYKEALNYINIDFIDDLNISMFVKSIIKLGQYDKLRLNYDSLKNEEMKLKMLNCIEEEISKISEKEQNKIRTKFMDIGGDYSLYFKYKLTKYYDLESKIIDATFIYKKMNPLEFKSYYFEILAFLFQYEHMSLNLLNKFNREFIFQFIDYCYKKNYEEIYLKIIEWLNNINIQQSLLKNKFILKYILESVVLRAISDYKNTGIDLNIKNNINLFNKYVNIGLEIVEQIYVFDGISVKYEFITDVEHKFLILLHLYNKNKVKGNLRAALKYYKKATEAYPEMADFLKEYLDREVF